jgi:hypothetical protein
MNEIEYVNTRVGILANLSAFVAAYLTAESAPAAGYEPAEGQTAFHPEYGSVEIVEAHDVAVVVSVGDVTMGALAKELWPSAQVHADFMATTLYALRGELDDQINGLAREHCAPIGFFDVVYDRAAGIKDSVFEDAMDAFYERRYAKTTISAIESGDDDPRENWSFEDCNDGRYECRERPVVAYLIRDSESEDGIDLYGSAGSGGETTYPHGDHDKSYDLDYCWDQRDECEDAIGRLCAELDLEDSRFEIEEHEQDDDDTCRWGVWDTDSEEWIDVDGEGDIDSYDEDDEDDVERTVEEANDNDRRKNVHGLPFASSYCWDVTGNEWDWKFLADAGYIIATYSRDGETTTVAGVDGGGYNFASTHEAPAYLLMAADRDWLVKTEHGPRRVKADPMARDDKGGEA